MTRRTAKARRRGARRASPFYLRATFAQTRPSAQSRMLVTRERLRIHVKNIQQNVPGRGRGRHLLRWMSAAGRRRGGGSDQMALDLEGDAAVAVLVTARRGRRSPFGRRATGTKGRRSVC